MTALPIFLRPSTKFQEIDLTQRINVILSTIAATVGEFERGPVSPTYQSGLVEDFKNLYGKIAKPQISFAHDTVTSFMSQSGNILVNRVTRLARYAGLSVLKDSVNKRLIYAPFEDGVDESYETEGLQQLYVISFSKPFANGHTFNMDITDGESAEAISTVTYADSNNATLNDIAASITATLAEFAIGGSATVYKETTSSVANNKVIIVRVPQSTILDFLNVTTGGSAPPVVTVTDEARLFDVVAENPGQWANDYGIQINTIDSGVRERFRFTMSRSLVTSNKISVVVNDTVVTQEYTTNSDTTLAALATKLEALPEISSAVVEQVAGGTDNDRSILLIASEPGPRRVVFETVNAVTGGNAQAIMQAVVVMTGVVPDNSFYINVYDRSNVNRVEERFVVSLNQQQDNFGYQQNVAQVINRSSRRSDHIRIAQAPYATETGLLFADGVPVTTSDTISWMRGGDDGVKCTTAELRKGWAMLSDRQAYPVNILLNAGYTAVSVQKEMVALSEKRSDCMAILDAPSDRQKAQDLRDYRLNDLDIDSSYAAMYTPDQLIEDIDTGEERFIPPSGLIGATYAYSDRLTNSVGAPAGLNRGKVTLSRGMRYRYTDEEMELIYPVGLNYIIDRKGTGPVVMAEETLQFKKSVMSSVHARRIMNYIKTGLVDGLDYTLFDPNTDSTRFRARQLADTILGPMKRGDGSGGLYDYFTKCDKDNNPSDTIDADQLAFDVYLKIVRVIKGILIRGILTRTGANFEELVKEFN